MVCFALFFPKFLGFLGGGGGQFSHSHLESWHTIHGASVTNTVITARSSQSILCIKTRSRGTSLGVQWLRLPFPMQGVLVQSVVGELKSHMSCGQKN